VVLGCGGSDREDKNSGGFKADGSETVAAVILNYEISISDIPLVEPQTETIELAISTDALKYTSIAEIAVNGDSRKLERTSIIDFSEKSQTFLNREDSSFTVSFYDIAGEGDEGQREGDSQESGLIEISLSPTDEKRNIPPMHECRKVLVRSQTRSQVSKKVSDSIPRLNGDLWVYRDDEILDIKTAYYDILSGLLTDPEFDGLGLWRVLERLGIPREEIRGILGSLDGLAAEADLTVKMFSLGRKASVNISMRITGFEKKILPAKYFDIPAEYNPAIGT